MGDFSVKMYSDTILTVVNQNDKIKLSKIYSFKGEVIWIIKNLSKNTEKIF